MATGWARDADGSWYLASADPNDGSLQTGWQRVGGSWYWLDPTTCKMATGWVKVDGKSYCLSESGSMLFSTWVEDQNGRHWLDSSGALYATIVNDTIVYANSEDGPTSGLTRVGDTLYYADPQTGLLRHGEVQCNDGITRLFDEKTGAAVTAWRQDGDNNWHLMKDGVTATGWQKVSGTWYYLDPETTIMKTG